MNSYEPRSFDQLRQVVNPSLATLPGSQLRARIDGEYGEGTADLMEQDLEGFFSGIGRAFSTAARDVGRFAQQAAPVVAHIGSGVVQGAMAGSAAGLPGIIAGAAVGGTGAGLSRYGKGAARDIGGALSGVTSLASQFSPMGRAGGALGSTLGALGSAAGGRGRGGAGGAAGMLGGLLSSRQAGGGAGGIGGMLGGLLSSPQAAGALGSLFGGGRAVDQLSSLIRRPELQQAMAAMRLGNLGRSAIPVGGGGGSSVPVGAFAQLLSHLVGEAAAEMAEFSSDAAGEAAENDFMRGESGEFAGDPSLLTDRTARLWGMLNEAQYERLAEAVEAEWSDAEAEHYEADYADADFADGDSADADYADDEYADDDAETEWEIWESEQEFLDSLDLADADAIDAALYEQEADYAW
jgi:hypothetical protein